MPADATRSLLWPADNPAVTAHITLLQGIINRLANNSASCKTWCLTLVAALLSLAGAARAPAIVTFVLVPIVVFGYLDSMYLAQERAYRLLYARIVDAIRSGSYGLTDAFDARAPLKRGAFWSALVSWSVFPLYLGLIVTYLVVHFTGWLRVLAVVSK